MTVGHATCDLGAGTCPKGSERRITTYLVTITKVMAIYEMGSFCVFGAGAKKQCRRSEDRKPKRLWDMLPATREQVCVQKGARGYNKNINKTEEKGK